MNQKEKFVWLTTTTLLILSIQLTLVILNLFGPKIKLKIAVVQLKRTPKKAHPKEIIQDKPKSGSTFPVTDSKSVACCTMFLYD